MNDLDKILSEGRRYDFNGDYLVSRSPTEEGRHIYSFSGNLACLSEKRIIGQMTYDLTPEKSYLILGLLNDEELQFSQISTYDRMCYCVTLVNPFRLKFEGKCKQIGDLQNFSEMLVSLPEINESSVHDVKNFNYDLLSKIDRERLSPYFQKGQLDKITGRRTNFVTLNLKEI